MCTEFTFVAAFVAPFGQNDGLFCQFIGSTGFNILCVVGPVSIIFMEFWSPWGKKSIMNLLKILSNDMKCPLLLVETTVTLHPLKEMGFSEIELSN